MRREGMHKKSAPRLLLHIGAPKTGSSAIQETIQSALPNFCKNVDAPSVSSTPQYDLPLTTFHAERWNLYSAYEAENAGMRHCSLNEWREHIETLSLRLKTQIAQSSATTIVLSSELLWFTLDETEIERLAGALCPLFDSITILAYLRNPLDHAISFWSTKIGVGEISASLSLGRYGERNQTHLQALDAWERAFPGSVRAVMFEDEIREHGGVVASFFFQLEKIMGVETIRAVESEPYVNPRLSWQQTLVLSYLNSVYPALDDRGWLNKRRAGLRDDVKRIATAGGTYLPSTDELASFTHGVAADAERLSSKYKVSSELWLKSLEQNPNSKVEPEFDPRTLQLAETILRERRHVGGRVWAHTKDEQMAPFDRSFPDS